ncbi:Peptidoglycan biosynthesis protein, SpoVB type [Syntrophomonas zehnderi OL-4]|uniref:Peptidoglycan biosynthesis protein, SpoVB type n=1 Tax=Syntrophomonas zehnderi OL-4 TaxID=690567 RepID=A0A0E4G9Q0_9FIRM|nr:polysaccharide biosynthesis protein [Syntrophomonas zehnderi]CFX10425.1 Peptidoglycan biosynthesis protein, SpoVB type [Syntrophomonas zehnderi OL-4]
MEKKSNFLKGALILSIAGAISKILGAIYRIPLARLLGAEGMGLYQMAYPIYTTILALATAGVPVAISVLVSRRETEGYSGDSKRIFKVSLLMLFIFGILLTLLVMQAAHFLAAKVLHEPRAYYPILAVAPAIFFSGLMSVFRGYFQGYQWMLPTAVSQVIEQLFRVTAVLILAFLLFPRGLEYAAAGATFGAVVGGIVGLIVLICFYIFFQKKNQGLSAPIGPDSSFSLAREVVRLAIPVSFGAVILPLVQMLDAIIVPGRLMAINYTTSQATALYGQLSGMAAVLISLPTIFTISIATSLVPAVSEALAKKDYNTLNSRINYGLRAAMIISLPCAAGLYVLAYQICDLLYAAPEAGLPLEVLAFSTIVLAAFQLSSAGLQGIGRPEVAMRSLIITGALKVLFNFTLTSVPALNIQGAAIGTVLAFTVGSGLNLYYLKRFTKVHYETGRLLKLTLATVLMAIGVKISYALIVGSGIHSHISTLIAICIGVGIYGILLLLLKELDRDMLRKIIS